MGSNFEQKHLSSFKALVLFTFVCLGCQSVFAADSTGSPESDFGELTQKIQNLSHDSTIESSEHIPVDYYPKFLAQGTEETLRERVSTGANNHAWILKRHAAITLFSCLSGAGFIYGAYRAIYDNCVAQNCKYFVDHQVNPLFGSLEPKAGGGGFGGIFGGLLSVASVFGNAIYGTYIWHKGDKTYNSIPLANLIRASISIYDFKLSLQKIEDEKLPDEDVSVIRKALKRYYIEKSLSYSHDNMQALSKNAKFEDEKIMKIAERVYWAACGGLFATAWEKLSPSQAIKKVLNDAEYFASVNKALKNILDEKARNDFLVELEEK